MVTSREGSVAVGLTVKSGWASTVVVRLDRDDVVLVDSARLELSDPAIPDGRQPYHAGFATARAEHQGLASLVNAVQEYGTRAASTLFASYAARHAIAGAGLVVGSLIDPDTIANPHIRIHALEGRLFRECIEAAARECEIQTRTWRERDLYGEGAATLRRPEAAVRATLTALGRAVTGGWRAEHKAAALAAWLLLHSSGSGRGA